MKRLSLWKVGWGRSGLCRVGSGPAPILFLFFFENIYFLFFSVEILIDFLLFFFGKFLLIFWIFFYSCLLTFAITYSEPYLALRTCFIGNSIFHLSLEPKLLNSCLVIYLIFTRFSENQLFWKKVQSEAGQLLRSCLIFGQNFRRWRLNNRVAYKNVYSNLASPYRFWFSDTIDQPFLALNSQLVYLHPP